MSRPSEEDLILHLYGEADDPSAIEQALAEDPELAQQLALLDRALTPLAAVPVPERGASYGAEVWARLEPALGQNSPLAPMPGKLLTFPLRRKIFTAALAAAAILLLAVGYWVGRASAPPAPELAHLDRTRLVANNAAAHFAGSERLLIELANQPAGERLDLAEEREWAAALLLDNRLLRRAAERAGQRRIAAVLSELEPFLLELAHAPETLEPAELEGLQERLAESGTLFKLKTTAARLERADRLRRKHTI